MDTKILGTVNDKRAALIFEKGTIKLLSRDVKLMIEIRSDIADEVLSVLERFLMFPEGSIVEKTNAFEDINGNWWQISFGCGQIDFDCYTFGLTFYFSRVLED